MKTILLLIVIFSLSLLSGVELISQNFSGYPTLPSGWTMTGPTTTNWSSAGTNFAGGTTGELRFTYTPTGTGTYRFISPMFNTERIHDMALSFRYMLDDYTTASNYTIGVQISKDLTSWTNLWSVTGSSDIAANQISIPFSFELGKSSTTYIAFYFTGDTNDLDYWYIDDISLTYSNTLGYGTWSAGDYHPVGNIIVPDGYTCTLSPDVHFYFQTDKNLTVNGRLLISGTEGHEVLLTSNSGATDWKGVDLITTNTANDSTLINHAIIEHCSDSGIRVCYNKCRISNSEIRENVSDGLTGSGIFMNQNAIIENCSIHNNTSEYLGAAILSAYCTPIIRSNRLFNNLTGFDPESCALFLQICDVSNVYNNQIVNNYINSSCQAVYMSNCTGDFKNNLVANNEGRGIYISGGSIHIKHCNIINNADYGLECWGSCFVESSIIWGNNTNQIFTLASTTTYVSYSCIEGGISGIDIIIPANYTNNVSGNPLFTSPTAGRGFTFDALVANWSLQYNSPCIDSGNPGLPLNQDGSIEDIGIYYRLLKPVITRTADVTPDQGHQIYLRWIRSDIDVTFLPNAYYSIWRLNTSRNDNAVCINSPLQLTLDIQSENRNICWRDGSRVWDYLTDVHAINFSEYGVTVSTIQDSSSTGTHAADYMVVYQNNIGFWPSIVMSGYSVDNIPPYSARGLDLQHTGTNQFNISWQEVTEGGWEGNSYPETNRITYKVYAGDSPDFETTPFNLIITTTNPTTILNSQTADNKFYKIICSDSE